MHVHTADRPRLATFCAVHDAIVVNFRTRRNTCMHMMWCVLITYHTHIHTHKLTGIGMKT